MVKIENRFEKDFLLVNIHGTWVLDSSFVITNSTQQTFIEKNTYIVKDR